MRSVRRPTGTCRARPLGQEGGLALLDGLVGLGMLEESAEVKLVPGVDGQGRRMELERPPLRLGRGVETGLWPGWLARGGAARRLGEQVRELIVGAEVVVVVILVVRPPDYGVAVSGGRCGHRRRRGKERWWGRWRRQRWQRRQRRQRWWGWGRRGCRCRPPGSGALR